MQVGHNATAGKRSVSPGVIVVAIVVLVAFIGFIGHRNLAPSRSDGLTVPKTETTKWIEGLAAQSGGDINKLNPEDQHKLQRVSRGQGAMMLKMLAPKK